MENLMTAPSNSGEAETPTTEVTQVETPETTETVETTEVKAPEGAPEKYEIKPLEGSVLDADAMESYETVMRELDMPQEKAQALFDKIGPIVKERQMAQLEAAQTQWANDSKADKEFGGDKLDENLGVAKKALDKFGTPELTELINVSGLGNHPELIRFFYRAGKALSEDNFVGGHKGNNPSGPKTFNQQADVLYPNK